MSYRQLSDPCSSCGAKAGELCAGPSECTSTALTVYNHKMRGYKSGLAVCAGTIIAAVLALLGVPAASCAMLPMIAWFTLNGVWLVRDHRALERMPYRALNEGSVIAIENAINTLEANNPALCNTMTMADLSPAPRLWQCKTEVLDLEYLMFIEDDGDDDYPYNASFMHCDEPMSFTRENGESLIAAWKAYRAVPQRERL